MLFGAHEAYAAFINTLVTRIYVGIARSSQFGGGAVRILIDLQMQIIVLIAMQICVTNYPI